MVSGILTTRKGNKNISKCLFKAYVILLKLFVRMYSAEIAGFLIVDDFLSKEIILLKKSRTSSIIILTAVGGIAAAINGGSFLEGFADGALSGVVSGAVTGAACAGLGALGALAGKSIQCMSTVGKAINVISKVTAALSFGMDGFDMLAMGISLFDPSNALVEFNQKLHSNALYNGFQIAVNALAVFTAGAASTMKCFIMIPKIKTDKTAQIS